MTTKTSAQGSGEFVLQNLTVTSVDFIDNVEFSPGAAPSATGVIIGCDTIAASDFKGLFKVKIDSADLNDVAGADLQYKAEVASAATWTGLTGNHLGKSQATAAALDPAQNNFANSTSTDTNAKLIGDASVSVKNDYVRYLAEKITGSVYGSDLFSNEAALVSDATNWDNISSSINTNIASALVAQNSYSTGNSACKDLMDTFLNTSAGIEKVLDEINANGSEDTTDHFVEFSPPLATGDKVYIKVTVDYNNGTDTEGTWKNQNDGSIDSRNVQARDYLLELDLQ